MKSQHMKLLQVLALLNSVKESLKDQEQDIKKVEWWKQTNVYHIYVRSFKDSNGDGQGDLRGVIEELDYLKAIGVETLLLSPFYSSPMMDGGYDIDDYVAINPHFGTMEDFDQLTAGVKQRGMRLVVDFVPNHSSNKHKWFECSERALIEPERCGKYKDYYVWSNSTRFNNSLPTNWISLFNIRRGLPHTAWRWSEIRKEFYFHQFLAEQPDLNLRSPLVRDELKEIVRFWLRRGVDGIRVDAQPFLLEDTIYWRNEPRDPKWRANWDEVNDYLKHIYTQNLPESGLLLEDWRGVFAEPEFAGSDLVLIAEAYAVTSYLPDYYGPSPDRRFADLPFSDALVVGLSKECLDAEVVERAITNWLVPVRELGWPDDKGAISPWSLWVTGTHDQSRLAERYGERSAVSIQLISCLLPGTPQFYYGDELGLHDADSGSILQSSIDEGEASRLACRTPMAWKPEEPAAGFSTNSSTWLPLNPDYRRNNVETLLEDKHKNQLNNFIQMLRIRRQRIETLTFGDIVFFRPQTDPKDAGKGVLLRREKPKVFAMARIHQKFGNLLLLVNFNPDKTELVNLAPGILEYGQSDIKPPISGTVVMLNFLSNDGLYREGGHVVLQGLQLAPNQSAVIEFRSS